MQKIYSLLILFGMASFSLEAQLVIKNTTIHTGRGQVIENADVLINASGIIENIGKNLETPPNTPSFDGTNKHLYPGVIAPANQLGLTEVESVRATNDFNEVGSFNPHVRSLVAFNTDGLITPTIRSSGVLITQATPLGGLISGKSSVMLLKDGLHNWEEAAYKIDDGLWIDWPTRYVKGGWWGERTPTKLSEEYQKYFTELNNFIKESKAYCENTPKETNIRMQAMCSVWAKKTQVYIRADDAASILVAVTWAKELGLQPVIVGGADSWRVADFLAKESVAVILSRIHRLPENEDDDYDQPYKTPQILHEKGVLFCMSMDDFWQQRNIINQAGHAVGFGLNKEIALSTVTYNTAKILGIETSVGSIETGKDATMIVTEGDLLDAKSSTVTHAWIKGKATDLDDKQKKLNREYIKKYGF